MKNSHLTTATTIVLIGVIVAGGIWLGRTKTSGRAVEAPSNIVTTSPAPTDPYESMLTSLTGTFNEAFEKRYINTMLTHQAITVDMARLVVDSSQPAIRDLSKSLIDQQTAEAASLRAWAKQWGYEVEEPNQQKIDQVTAHIRSVTGVERDQQFATAILDHASGRLLMAQLVATNSIHDELKNVAIDITTTQTAQFITFEQWAKKTGMIKESGAADAHSRHDEY